MANLALETAGEIRVVESVIQLTVPEAETLAVGQPARFDTSTGKATKANGTTAAEAAVYGIVSHRSADGVVTLLRKGVLDGFALDALDFGADVFLSNTDGTLADTAGTVSTVVGHVVPGTATTLGTTYDKLLFVDL